VEYREIDPNCAGERAIHPRRAAAPTGIGGQVTDASDGVDREDQNAETMRP